MTDKVIIDTNVLVVANARTALHATEDCIIACTRFLNTIKDEGHLVIDDAFEIITEYRKQVNQSGQTGVGDAFLKWVLTNLQNEARCTCVHITQHRLRAYEEFPDVSALERFDRSDRKFVAIALAHPDRPAIANAVDRDWIEFGSELSAYGIKVLQLCEIALRRPLHTNRH